jgi:hypothetical protein
MRAHIRKYLEHTRRSLIGIIDTSPLFVLYAISLHLIWAICAFLSDSAYNGTAFAGVYAVFGDASPYACLFVASCAIVALFNQSTLSGFMLMMPQQMMLFLSAFSALHGMIDAHFADGVIRSREFIVADQIPAVLGATAHTIAMMRIALDRVRLK